MREQDQPSFDWETDIRDTYRRIIGYGDAAKGSQRREAFEEVADLVEQMVETGDLKVPVRESIMATLHKIDSSESSIADKVLDQIVHGQFAFDFETDPMLDVVVALGKGLRKPWRHANAADLMAMDALRYKNARDAANAYDKWRANYDLALPVVGQHGSFGAAVIAGAFSTTS